MRVYVVPVPGRKFLQLRWEDDNGKIRQKSSKTTVKRDAERAAARLEAELQQKAVEAEQQLTLAQSDWSNCVQQWMNEHVSRLAPKTIKSYKTAVTSIQELMAPTEVSQINSSFMAKYIDRCIAEEMSPNTIAGYLRHLKVFFNWLIENDRIAKMPRAKPPKSHKQAHGRPLQLEEFERMLETVPLAVGGHRSKRWVFDLMCLWLSGLRIEEAFELQWESDVGISIKGFKRQQPMLWFPANEDKSREESLLPLVPDWVEYLRDNTKPEHRKGHVLHLIGKRGSRLQRADTAGKVVAHIGKLARIVAGRDHKGDVLYASAHDLRRSFGTRWATEVEAPVLQKMMRHKSIATTMTFYSHVNAVRIGEKINEAYARQKKLSGDSLASQE